MSGSGLARGSLVYLALPNLIWLATWLRPTAAIPCLLLALLGCGLWIKRTDEARPIPWLTCLLAAAVVTSLSGAGGIGLQNWDYDKHNAVLHDLITRPLPVRYPDVGDPDLAGPLVYYMGWYMPAMLAGRAFGWAAANVVLFLWSFIGLGLSLAWVSRLVPSAKWTAPVGFLFFSGLDIVGALASGRWPLAMTNLEMHHWAGFAQYTHQLALINWVPHHAFAMWIGTAMILDSKERGSLLGVWCLLPFWSPWAAIGTAPLLTLRAIQTGKGRWMDPSSLLILLGVLPPVGAFLASSRGNVVREWAWSHSALPPFLGMLLVFWVLEFAVVAGLVYKILAPKGTDRAIFAVATGGLFLLPLYRFGISSDLTMRASVPLLFVLAIYTLRAVQQEHRLRPALLGVLAVGALSPLHELGYSLIHYRFGPPDPGEIRPVPFTDGRHYARQFVGDPGKPFWRWFGKN